jgi:uncharacterized OsmC-like protein
MSIRVVIDQTRSAVEADTANAQVQVSAGGHLVGPTEVELRTGRHSITVDEPPALGGEDRAASPVNQALVALASCQAITYRFWAEQLGIALDDVDVDVDADLDLRGFFGLDDTVRSGFGDVRVKVTPKGPETAERYDELARAVDAHCPVLDLFANATPVTTSLAVAAS